LAPTVASAVLRPARALAAPQTICSSSGAGAHLAHLQLVGLRMAHGLDDFRDHDAAERRRRGLDALPARSRTSSGASPVPCALQGTSTNSRSHEERYYASAGPELREETQVVLEEQAQVIHAVTKHGRGRSMPMPKA
jgi:hypothetical protein